MTARFEGTRTYAAQKDRIFRACVAALQRSGFTITASDLTSGSISALSPDSQFSSRPDSGFLEEVGLIVADLTGLLSKFRERISVRIDEHGGVHALSVSEPRTVRLDQGRNMRHVLGLWEALDATLGLEMASAKVTGDASGAHAFLSYAREDSGQVDAVQRALEAAGVRVWRDTSQLWPGEDWRARIRDAITRDALVFIACFSRRSVARDSSYQNEELILAIDQLRQRRPDVPWLIPVRFDDCAVPEYDIGAGRTLTSLQRADVFGDGRDEATGRLIETVLRIFARRPSR